MKIHINVQEENVELIAQLTANLIGDESTRFGMEDFLADLDAVNIYTIYRNGNYGNLLDAIKYYYSSTVPRKRIRTFLDTRFNGSTSVVGITQQVHATLGYIHWDVALALVTKVHPVSINELDGLAKGFAAKLIYEYILETNRG